MVSRCRFRKTYGETVIVYLTLVVAGLALMELSRGIGRLYLQVMIFAGRAIGLAGISFFTFTGSKYKLVPYNNLVAAGGADIGLYVCASRHAPPHGDALSR